MAGFLPRPLGLRPDRYEQGAAATGVKPIATAGRWAWAAVLVAVAATLLASLWLVRGTRRGASGDAAGEALLGVPADGSVVVPAPPEAMLHPEVLDVSDAVRAGRIWFILDRRQGQVHRLNPDGHLLGSFSRKGEGPGELRLPEALAIHGDTLVVLERHGGRLHLFGFDGELVGERTLEGGERCPGPGSVGLASTPAGLLVLVACMDLSRALEARVYLETADGTVRRLATSAPNHGRDGSLSPLFLPVLAARPGGFVFGLAAGDCLGTFDLQGHGTGSVCHHGIERMPLPQGLQSELSRMRTRAEAAGLRVAGASHLPPFDRVFAGPGGDLLYRSPTPPDGQARSLVRQASGGGERLVGVPPAATVFAAGDQALAAWDDLGGSRILIYALPDRDDAST